MKGRFRTDILERKEDILRWIEQDKPKAYICRKIKCKQETLNSYLDKMGIQYVGNQGARGIPSRTRMTALEYASKSHGVSPLKLKNKLIQDGLREHKCEGCNNVEWGDSPIPIELHHVDGDRFNNKLENLKILCPNCHAQTPNHCGKNSYVNH